MLRFIGGAVLAATLAIAPATSNISTSVEGPAQAHAAPLTPAVARPSAPPTIEAAFQVGASDSGLAPGQAPADFRNWVRTSAESRADLIAFRDYLAAQGVESVVPFWELTRTSSSWRECGAEPFEAPPRDKWDHVVTTLKFVRDEVVPAVGAVEVLSGYRNEKLNKCSDGAPKSAHREYYALDMTPVNPAVTRAEMIRSVCAAHARDGRAYDAGLGFYSGRRFHVDSSKFRKWGPDGRGATSPCVGARA